LARHAALPGAHSAESSSRSLHDALPISEDVVGFDEAHLDIELGELGLPVGPEVFVSEAARDLVVAFQARDHQQLLEQLRRLRQRSEEHTSELQSRFDLVCRLLLEKKKVM